MGPDPSGWAAAGGEEMEESEKRAVESLGGGAKQLM